jgi:hypothetical protein
VTDALLESTEQLRLCTARLKAHRLKLPPPGTLLRVKYTAFLAPINSYNRISVRTHQCKTGSALLLVAIDTQPQDRPVGVDASDLIELIVLLPDEMSLWKTGVRESQDLFAIYEVVGEAAGR